MPLGEVRAQVDARLQLAERLVVTAAQPERSAHGPVGSRVAIVDHEALSGCLERVVDLRRTLDPSLKSILKVGEG
jgi:hypothetical protein